MGFSTKYGTEYGIYGNYGIYGLCGQPENSKNEGPIKVTKACRQY